MASPVVALPVDVHTVVKFKGHQLAVDATTTSLQDFKRRLHKAHADAGVPMPKQQRLIHAGRVLSEENWTEHVRGKAIGSGRMTLMLMEQKAVSELRLVVRHVTGTVLTGFSVNDTTTVKQLTERAQQELARRRGSSDLFNAKHVLFAEGMVLDEHMPLSAFSMLGDGSIVYLLPSLQAAFRKAAMSTEAGAVPGGDGGSPRNMAIVPVAVPLEVLRAHLQGKPLPTPTGHGEGMGGGMGGVMGEGMGGGGVRTGAEAYGIPSTIRSGLASFPGAGSSTLPPPLLSLDNLAGMDALKAAISSTMEEQASAAFSSADEVYGEMVKKLEASFGAPRRKPARAEEVTACKSPPAMRGLRRGFLCSSANRRRKRPAEPDAIVDHKPHHPPLERQASLKRRLAASSEAKEPCEPVIPPGEHAMAARGAALRCGTCARKLSLASTITGKCRCGGHFCPAHLPIRNHSCDQGKAGPGESSRAPGT